MADANHPESLEEQIERWRNHVRHRPTGPAVELAKMEAQLRGEIAGLIRAGLATDEAFLIGVKRVSSRDALAGEFAREQSDRGWKHFAVAASDSGERSAQARIEALVAWGLAVLAAVAIKVPALFGIQM